MSLDFRVNILVLLLNNIDVWAQVVNVVDKRAVLLLRLAESRHNLIVAGNSSLLLDLVETIFNDSHIPHVHVHQSFFLLIVDEPFIKPLLKNFNGIWKWCHFLSCWSYCPSNVLLRGALFVFVTLLQFFLQLHNLHLKDQFVVFVLSLQRENLVISLFKMTLAHHDLLIDFLAVFNCAFDLTVVTAVDL